VCKAFDDRAVLKDVSFTVKRGETCVIMGRSGVGKSVSLKHIMGFLQADSGRILVDGVDVTHFTEAEFEPVRRKVTMVFQSGALFDSLTVRDNIAFPLDGQPGLTYDDLEAYVAKIANMLEVDHVLLRLKKAFHKTSIVVTHDTHLAKKLADVVVFLQEGEVSFFGPWAGFESSNDPFLKNFRMQDELIPALDVTL
jgi:phospholipid/cholesterol/gamma-HCH transport system ATP-binding protein